MHILIAYASRSGSARGVAEAIARRLHAAGHTVDVRDIGDVEQIEGYDAVVLGSAIYDTAWLRSAQEFAQHNRQVLARVPAWLFSVGTFSSDEGWPFGQLARREPKEVDGLKAALHRRDYHVFAGAINRDDVPLLRRLFYRVLKGRASDFRNWREIDIWAERIVRELTASRSPHGRRDGPGSISSGHRTIVRAEEGPDGSKLTNNRDAVAGLPM